MDIISYAMGKQSAGSGGNYENKEVEITTNTETTITPSDGYDALSSVKVTTNVPSVNINDYFDSTIANDSGYAYTTIKKMPSISFNNYDNISYSFSRWSKLKEIEEIKGTQNTTNMNNMFAYCTSLEKVPVFSWASATNLSSMFTNCNSLSDESLNNIMYMCINATSYTGTKTLYALSVPSTKRSRCPNLSNYQAFLDAGWTLS